MSLIAKLVFVFVIFSGFSAQAAQWGGFIGLNTTEYSGDGDWGRDFGIELGASYVMPLWKSLLFRTGGGVVQKNSEDGAIAVKFNYLEFPLTLALPVSADWMLIAGLNFDFLLSTSPGSISGEENFMFTLPVGFQHTLQGPHSLQAFFEMGMTDMASGSGGTYQIGNSLIFRYHYSF